jgi:hypothetical protein
MNQVAEKKNGALAANLFEADAQQGAQNISQEDLALPFLKILGQLSPEVNKRDGKYVEGAEPGKIINTVTNELYDSLNVVPCHDNTANHFVLALGDNPTTALISMKSTQLKISRKWNSMMMGIKMQGKNGLFTPPTYSHIYKLSTVQMSNDKGTWFGWDVSKVGPVEDKNMYDMAKNFATSVGKGEIQAKHGSEENESKQPY